MNTNKTKNLALEKFQKDLRLGLAKYYSNAISDNIKRAFERKRREKLSTGNVKRCKV